MPKFPCKLLAVFRVRYSTRLQKAQFLTQTTAQRLINSLCISWVTIKGVAERVTEKQEKLRKKLTLYRPIFDNFSHAHNYVPWRNPLIAVIAKLVWVTWPSWLGLNQFNQFLVREVHWSFVPPGSEIALSSSLLELMLNACSLQTNIYMYTHKMRYK